MPECPHCGEDIINERLLIVHRKHCLELRNRITRKNQNREIHKSPVPATPDHPPAYPGPPGSRTRQHPLKPPVKYDTPGFEHTSRTTAPLSQQFPATPRNPENKKSFPGKLFPEPVSPPQSLEKDSSDELIVIPVAWSVKPSPRDETLEKKDEKPERESEAAHTIRASWFSPEQLLFYSAAFLFLVFFLRFLQSSSHFSAIVCLIISVTLFLLSIANHRNTWLKIFPERFIARYGIFSTPRALEWHSVETLRFRARKIYLQGLPFPTRYQLIISSRELSLTVDSRFERTLQVITSFIDLLHPFLLEKAVKKFLEGYELDFGPIKLTQTGIKAAGEFEGPEVPFGELAFAGLIEGRFIVNQIGKTYSIIDAPVSEIPNYFVLDSLLSIIRSALA